MIKLIIPGRPIPAVRMTQKSKFANPYAQRYLSYKQTVAWIAKTQCNVQLLIPVEVEIRLYLCGGNQGDLDNYAKSLTDACNQIIYKDDRQIQRLVVEKFQCGKTEERAEVDIRTVG